MSEIDIKRIKESKLLEKCREIAECLGGTISGVADGRRVDFVSPDKDFRVSYHIDWGGRQRIYVSRVGGEKLLVANNLQKQDNPSSSSIEIGEGAFKVRVYEKGSWEQRIHDIYFGMSVVPKRKPAILPMPEDIITTPLHDEDIGNYRILLS